MVASITSRVYSEPTDSGVHKIEAVGSFNNKDFFVGTTDIYPTRIATIPFCHFLKSDEKYYNDKAISLNRAIKIGVKEKWYSTSEKVNPLSHIIMLTLHPDRLAMFPKKRPFKLYQC